MDNENRSYLIWFRFQETNKERRYHDLEALLSYFALCNDSDLYSECLDESDPIRKCTDQERVWRIRGSPTEAALMTALEKVGLHKYVLDEAWPRISEIPFTSDRKFMATLHEPSQAVIRDHPTLVNKDTNLLIVKGAPERIETFLKIPSGTRGIIEEFASQGLRVLACAIKYLPREHQQVTEEDLTDMEFIGLSGINDPPREGVRDYINKALVVLKSLRNVQNLQSHRVEEVDEISTSSNSLLVFF